MAPYLEFCEQILNSDILIVCNQVGNHFMPGFYMADTHNDPETSVFFPSLSLFFLDNIFSYNVLLKLEQNIVLFSLLKY